MWLIFQSLVIQRTERRPRLKRQLDHGDHELNTNAKLHLSLLTPELCKATQIADRQMVAGTRRELMNNLIYIVGLIVVIVAVLSFFGLR